MLETKMVRVNSSVESGIAAQSFGSCTFGKWNSGSEMHLNLHRPTQVEGTHGH